MQGIKISLDEQSIKKAIDDFKKLLNDLEGLRDRNPIDINIGGFAENLKDVINSLDNMARKTEETKEKMKTIFDVSKSGSFKKEDIDIKDYEQLSDIIAKIKMDSGQINKINILENDKGTIKSAMIEYSNSIGKVTQQYVKLKELVNDKGEVTGSQLVTDKTLNKENIEKSIQLLEKYQKEVSKIQTTFNKANIGDKGDVAEVNSESESLNNIINNLIENRVSLTREENQQLEESILKLKTMADNYIEIDELIKKEISDNEKLAIYEHNQQLEDSNAKKKQDTKEVLDVYKQEKEEELKIDKMVHDEKLEMIYDHDKKEKELNDNRKRDTKEVLDVYREEEELKAKILAENVRQSKLGSKVDSPLNINSSDEDIKKFIETYKGLDSEITKVNSTLDKNGNAIKEVQFRVKEGTDAWKLYQLNIDKTSQSSYILDKGMKDFQNRQLSLSSSIEHAVSKLMEWAVATNLVYGAFNQFRSGFDFINNLNESLTEIGIVTYQNQGQTNALAQEYNALAKELNVTTGEVAKASVEFYRQGLTQDQVTERLRTTTQYAKISNLDFNESAQILTATVNSMGVGITRTADVFSYLGDATASGADEIGRALQKVAGSSNALNVPLEKIGSWIAELSGRTRESSEVIGNSLKNIMARYEQLRERGFTEDDNTKINQVAKSLNEVGIEIMDEQGNFRNFGIVMDELGAKWKTLDNRHQAYIATTLAGTLQQSRFLNLMNNYSDSLNLYEGALNSAGTTQQKYTIWMESTESHINNLKSEAEGLWIKVFDSKSIQNGLDSLTGLVDILDLIVDKIGTFPTTFGIIFTALALFKKEFSAFKVDWEKWTPSNKFSENFNFAKNNLSGWGSSAIKGIVDGFKSWNTEFLKLNSQVDLYNLTANGSVRITTLFSNAIKAVGTSSLLANIGVLALRAGIIALNIVAGILIGVVISKLIEGFSKLFNSAKDTKVAVNELLNSFQHAIQQNNSSIQTLISISNEYDTLRKKTALTADEQKRFNELNNQLAQISPNIVQSWDNQGNAVLRLKNGVKDLITELEHKNQIENAKLLNGGDDALKDYHNSYNELQASITRVKAEMDKLINGYEVYGHGQYHIDGLNDLIKKHGESSSEVAKQNALIEVANQKLEVYKSQLQGSADALTPFKQAILNISESYKNLDDSMKSVLQDQLRNIDLSKVGDFADLNVVIEAMITALNNPEIQSGYNNIKRLQDQFNNKEISASDYNKGILGILTEMAKKLNDANPNLKLTGELLAEIFKIDFANTNEQTKTFSDLLEEVANKANDAKDEISNVNKVLDEHAKSGEWDIKTLVELTKTYPNLLALLGNDIELEKALKNIVVDKTNTITASLRTEITNLATHINEKLSNYKIDVRNFTDAESAKDAVAKVGSQVRLAIQKEEINKLNAMYDSGNLPDNQYIRRLTGIGNRTIIDIETDIDKYFQGQTALANVGKYLSGIGSSNYDGKTNGGSATSAQNDLNNKLTTLRSHLNEALKKKYEEDRDNELKALKEKEDAEIAFYNGKIKNLQDEIDALQDTKKDDEERLTALKKELSDWSRDDTQAGNQKRIDLQKQIDDLTKQMKIKDLEDEKKIEEDLLKDIQDSYQKQQDAINAKYDNILLDKNTYAEADKLITAKAQDDILSLLLNYAPDYSKTGAVLGKSMAQAMLEEIQAGLSAKDALLAGGSSSSSSSTSSSSGSSSVENARTLQVGSRGDDVKRLQQYLGITADGIFGNQTKQAVMNFQRLHNLLVDGIVGRNTHRVLGFDEGGIADFTGLAMLHGTKDKPERVLPASLTKSFDELVYNILPKLTMPQIPNKSNLQMPEGLIQNEINITNNTPFDVGNNMDNIDRMLKNSMRTMGYKMAMR